MSLGLASQLSNSHDALLASTATELLPWIGLVGVVFGIGVAIIARRRAGNAPAVSTSTPPVVVAENVVNDVVEDQRVEEQRVKEPTDDTVEASSVDSIVEAEPRLEPEPEPEPEPVVPSVRERTSRTRSLFASAFQSIRGRGIDNETWDELEETLLRADLGVGLTTSLIEPLRAQAKAQQLRTPDDVIAALREAMTSKLVHADRTLRLDAVEKPNVWLFVGVNGVGKTTTIGKVGAAQSAAGHSVLMAAGDTFRAAAAEQLQVWAERSGASFVRGAEGGDPASVVFDGIQSAAAKGIDLVLGDTAGRLQNKSNLMEELRKVRRVADKAPGTVTEVLLVIDATTGQNGLSQAREFAAATDVTGVVLTKLDGSAKGGIVFAIETELGIPVKLVGVGEGIADLVPFDPAEFVTALFE